MGDANHAKPKFTSFNDIHLADVFERPSAEMTNPYCLAFAIGIPALFCVFLGVQFLLSAISLFRDSSPYFFRSQSAKNMRSGQHTGGEKEYSIVADLSHFSSCLNQCPDSYRCLLVRTELLGGP